MAPWPLPRKSGWLEETLEVIYKRKCAIIFPNLFLNLLQIAIFCLRLFDIFIVVEVSLLSIVPHKSDTDKNCPPKEQKP